MSKEKQVYLVTYNARYENPEAKSIEGCIIATDWEDANEKLLKWLDNWNKEREADGNMPEDENEFDLDPVNILDYE
jgi:hypothetical protein